MSDFDIDIIMANPNSASQAGGTGNSHSHTPGGYVHYTIRMQDRPDFTFVLPKNVSGQEVFAGVLAGLELGPEAEYFGLFFPDTTPKQWLSLQELVKKQTSIRNNTVILQFGVKFFVSHPNKLVHPDTQWHFFRQILDDLSTKKLIIHDRETKLQLWGHAAQAQLKDFDPSVHKHGYLVSGGIVPAGISIDDPQSQTDVQTLHERLNGVPPYSAMFNFLLLACQQEAYGCEFFSGIRQGKTVVLGISCFGIKIYPEETPGDERTRLAYYSWSDIGHISYRGRVFTVVQRGSKGSNKSSSKKDSVRCQTKVYCHSMWSSAVQRHTFHRRKRVPLPMKEGTPFRRAIGLSTESPIKRSKMSGRTEHEIMRIAQVQGRSHVAQSPYGRSFTNPSSMTSTPMHNNNNNHSTEVEPSVTVPPPPPPPMEIMEDPEPTPAPEPEPEPEPVVEAVTGAEHPESDNYDVGETTSFADPNAAIEAANNTTDGEQELAGAKTDDNDEDDTDEDEDSSSSSEDEDLPPLPKDNEWWDDQGDIRAEHEGGQQVEDQQWVDNQLSAVVGDEELFEMNMDSENENEQSMLATKPIMDAGTAEEENHRSGFHVRALFTFYESSIGHMKAQRPSTTYRVISFDAGDVFYVLDRSKQEFDVNDVPTDDWWIIEDPTDFNNLAVIPSNNLLSNLSVSRVNEVLEYQPVHKVYPSETAVRPGLVVGPLKDEVAELLMERSPNFRGCVPYTSREIRDDDEPGTDYHFTTMDKMLEMIRSEQFVEHMTYNGHYYGTTYDSIREASAGKKQCIIPLHNANDTEKIRQAILGLKRQAMGPVVVFLRPTNKQSMQAVANQDFWMDEDDIEFQYSLSREIERDLSTIIDKTITFSMDIPFIAEKVESVFLEYSTRPFWAPDTCSLPRAHPLFDGSSSTAPPSNNSDTAEKEPQASKKPAQAAEPEPKLKVKAKNLSLQEAIQQSARRRSERSGSELFLEDEQDDKPVDWNNLLGRKNQDGDNRNSTVSNTSDESARSSSSGAAPKMKVKKLSLQDAVNARRVSVEGAIPEETETQSTEAPTTTVPVASTLAEESSTDPEPVSTPDSTAPQEQQPQQTTTTSEQMSQPQEQDTGTTVVKREKKGRARKQKDNREFSTFGLSSYDGDQDEEDEDGYIEIGDTQQTNDDQNNQKETQATTNQEELGSFGGMSSFQEPAPATRKNSLAAFSALNSVAAGGGTDTTPAATGNAEAIIKGELFDTHAITIERGVKGFGFSFEGGTDQPRRIGDDNVYVSRIASGGAAGNAGLKVGDRIIEANGTKFLKVTHETATRVFLSNHIVNLKVARFTNNNNRGGLGTAPGTTIVEHGRSTVMMEEVIEFAKVKGGLGFSLKGGADHPRAPGDHNIYISKIVPGGAADMDGRLQTDDRIVEANNTSLLGVTHGVAIAILRSNAAGVKLRIARKCERVKLIPDNGVYGLGIRGGKDSDGSLEISNLKAGSPAALAGLTAGYQIVHLNGILGSSLTLQEAKDEIRGSKNELDLIVYRSRKSRASVSQG